MTKKPVRDKISLDITEGQRLLIENTATAHHLKVRPFVRSVVLGYCSDYMRAVAADMGSFKTKAKRT